MSNVSPFPKKLTRLSPREQWRALQGLSTGNLLAALVKKYPEVEFTTDELVDSASERIQVEFIADGMWRFALGGKAESSNDEA